MFKSRDVSIHEFQENSKKDKIIEKLNELFQLFKYEDISSRNKESSTNSSNSYQTTHMVSFEGTYSIVEWSSEDLTSNEVTSYVRGYEASLNEIFKRWENESSTNEKESTSGRTIKESSSNKEVEVCLKASYEEDDYEVTKPSYKQLFKINVKYIEENDISKKRNLKKMIYELTKPNWRKRYI